MKSIFSILGCLMMFVLGFVFDGLITKVPREVMAVGDMIGAERVVRSYYDSKGAVPEIWSGFGVNSMTNRYGNQIEYSVTNNYYVTLRACGFGGEHSRVKNYFIRQVYSSSRGECRFLFLFPENETTGSFNIANGNVV